MDGFVRWLNQPDRAFGVQVHGSRAGLVELYGVVHVRGTDTYQLVSADSGAIFVYERSIVDGAGSQSIGTTYRPRPATLSLDERFFDALRSSTEWKDVGIEDAGGAPGRHLRTARSGLTDATFAVDPLPPDVAPELRGPVTLDAWVQPDGTPVRLAYSSASYTFTMLIDRMVGVPIDSDAAAPIRHTDPRFGFAFDVPPGMTFERASNGETSGPGPILIVTYCVPGVKGGLEAWAADGVNHYTTMWGEPDSVIQTAVLQDPNDVKRSLPIVLSTWTNRSDPSAIVWIVNAAFVSGRYSCDLQSFAADGLQDEAHARFDRMLVSLTLAR